MKTRIETGFRVRVRVLGKRTLKPLTNYYISASRGPGGIYELRDERERGLQILETKTRAEAKKALKCKAVRDIVKQTHWIVTEPRGRDGELVRVWMSRLKAGQYYSGHKRKVAFYIAEIVKFTRTITVEEEAVEALESKMPALLQIAEVGE